MIKKLMMKKQLGIHRDEFCNEMWEIYFYTTLSLANNLDHCDEDSFHQSIDEMISNINYLQLSLVESPHQKGQYGTAHLISFALSVYCDECINIVAISKGFDTDLLQAKLFNTLDGGKLFYEYVEYILSEKGCQISVYWVYYYLLKHGFRGMYDIQSHLQRSLYMRQLKLHLSENLIEHKRPNRKYWWECFQAIPSRFKRIPISFYWLLPLCSLLGSYMFINFS